MGKIRALETFSVFNSETGRRKQIWTSKETEKGKKLPLYTMAWTFREDYHTVKYRAKTFVNAKKRFKKDLETFNLKYGWDTGTK